MSGCGNGMTKGQVQMARNAPALRQIVFCHWADDAGAVRSGPSCFGGDAAFNKFAYFASSGRVVQGDAACSAADPEGRRDNDDGGDGR